tara:strand:- start:982 stop:1821 length:840 start_codon:yes stop_codon:yes gene_type:complete
MIKSDVLKRNRKMTLIIGARCAEGVVLASDTKIVDDTTGETLFSNKLIEPIEGASVVIGASGHTHLFRQFYRKIGHLVKHRAREIKLKNVVALEEVGEKISDYEREPKKEGTILDGLPYDYTAEDFLDDCKSIVKELCANGGQLDLVVGMFAHHKVRLHRIDSQGEEEEVGFCSVGSGTPFVNLFKKSYSPKYSFREVSSLLAFMILFVSRAKIDNFVGVEEGKLPTMKLVKEDNTCGELQFSEESTKEMLAEFNERIDTVVDFCDLNKKFDVVFRKTK